jgi:molybdopterin molybdotransferase
MREGSWDESFDLAKSTFPMMESESVLLNVGVSRVLARDIFSLCDLPAFATSSMDGWAVSGVSPWKVVGEVLTGKSPQTPITDSQCMKISTGGVIPTGATAVIPWERAQVHDEQVLGEVVVGENIRTAGVECQRGDLLFLAGTKLTPPMIGLLAATGHDQIEVMKKPRVGIFFLGDELLHTGVPEDGSIRDALGPVLPSLVENCGAKISTSGFVKDVLSLLNSRIAGVLDDVDVIITTGGTADGPRDFVRPAIAQLSGRYVVDCVKVRPGYHVLIAEILHGGRRIPFIALPGNPQSAIAAFTSFGKPIFYSMLGMKISDPIDIEIQESFKAQEGFSRLVPGNLDGKTFTSTGYLGSAMLRGVSVASGFALVAPTGKTARWLPF